MAKRKILVGDGEEAVVIFRGGAEVEVELSGQDGKVQVVGLVEVGAGEEADFKVVIRQSGAGSISSVKVLSVLAEGARKKGVMRTEFLKGAEGARGEEREEVIMLGEAENQSWPIVRSLEEKATGKHGVSIGRVEKKAVEYLMEKGLAKEAAVRLLLQGRIKKFLGEEIFERAFGKKFEKEVVAGVLGERSLSRNREREKSFPQVVVKCNRGDFGSFPQVENSKEMCYLDNAATTMKPETVIRAIEKFYREENANVARGLYEWSLGATRRYEEARKKVAEWIGADAEEVIFTRGATEALNMVAGGIGEMLAEGTDKTFAEGGVAKVDLSGRETVGGGGEIVVSELEHHSNMLPWARLAERAGMKLGWLECDERGEINEGEILKKIRKGVKIVAITAWSNVVGKTENLERILERAKEVGAITVVDATQAVAHEKICLKQADFVAFSGHKMYGPMGVGVLYGRKDILGRLAPMLVGGEMVEKSKPEPDIFLKAAQLCGLKPEQAVVLEDSENGIRAAVAAGIPVICVPDLKIPEDEVCRMVNIMVTHSLPDGQ